MWHFFVKRMLMIIPTLLLVSVIVFALIRLIPGDAAQIMLGDLVSDATIEEMRNDLHLDEPMVVQYGIWIKNIFTGDFGTSISTGEPVLEAITRRFKVTATVTLLALSLAMMIAIPAGIIAAKFQNTPLDLMIVFTMIFFMSLPSFWLGLILIYVFALSLGWFPTIGFVSLSQDFAKGLLFLCLPVLTLALIEMAKITRMVRSQALEVLRLDYVTHARAKGLSEPVVLMRHVFKNAFGPSLTVIGLTLGGLLGGAAVIETVFSLPGIGRLLVDSIYARDYPVLQGCLLLIAFVYVLVNFVVDVLYTLLDPRVRL